MYNWAGGNHFARNAGSAMVGIYYWDAPIASDNLAQGPERAHVSSTFLALAGVASQILASPAQNKLQVQVPFYPSSGGPLAPPDPGHIVFVYPGVVVDLGFLENHNSTTAIFVWQGKNFTVDPGTVVLAWANLADVLRPSPAWRSCWCAGTARRSEPFPAWHRPASDMWRDWSSCR